MDEVQTIQLIYHSQNEVKGRTDTTSFIGDFFFYFWHQFKEQLTDKKVAYISLFGKETISSIRTDVFLQVIPKKQKDIASP
jgi:hypothetical protein